MLLKIIVLIPRFEKSFVLENDEILHINEDIISGTTIIFKEFKNIDPNRSKKL